MRKETVRGNGEVGDGKECVAGCGGAGQCGESERRDCGLGEMGERGSENGAANKKESGTRRG